jgi:uncharacterized protein YciI
MRSLRSSWCVLSLLLATGCASVSSPPQLDYTLVLIRTGNAPPKLDKPARAAMFQGHFANMGKLARAGQLVLAGPYGKQKSAPDLRGIFVLDTADPAQAKAWAESDPGFQQGEFRFEFHRFATSAPLRAQLAADLAREDEIARSGRQPAPGEGGRGYVWLRHADFDTARRVLGALPAVLLLARLDGDAALVLLDAADAAAASALVAPLASALGDHRLDEWFGSGLLTGLPGRAAAALKE